MRCGLVPSSNEADLPHMIVILVVSFAAENSDPLAGPSEILNYACVSKIRRFYLEYKLQGVSDHNLFLRQFPKVYKL